MQAKPYKNGFLQKSNSYEDFSLPPSPLSARPEDSNYMTECLKPQCILERVLANLAELDYA